MANNKIQTYQLQLPDDATKFLNGQGSWVVPTATGTVTSITAGTGLDGGTITDSGTIALNAATQASLALADSAVQDLSDLSITATATELNYTSGVTSNIQTQLDGKIPTFADPNADRIVFWDDSAGAFVALTASTGLTISGTSMTVRAASATQTGIIEIATTTEVAAATDSTRAITPSSLSSITTLGTIGTGVWNGTAIADGYIASALTGKTYNGVSLTTAGSATNFLNEQGNYVSVSAAPGGSDTYVQYNDAGAFGGDANFTWDNTNLIFQVGDVAGTGNSTILSVDDSATGANVQIVSGGEAAFSIKGSTGDFTFTSATAGLTFKIDGTNQQTYFSGANTTRLLRMIDTGNEISESDPLGITIIGRNSNFSINKPVLIIGDSSGSTQYGLALEANNAVYGIPTIQLGFTGAGGALDMWNYRSWQPDGSYGMKFTTKGSGGSAVTRMSLGGNAAVSDITIANSILKLAASSTTAASLNIPSGTAPTSPNNGDMWFDGTDLKIRVGGVTKTVTLA